MSLRKFSVLLLAITFLCGCEGQKASTEPPKAAVKKDVKSQLKGNLAIPTEPP